MLHSVVFHPGLHCLQKYSFRGFWSTNGSNKQFKHYTLLFILQVETFIMMYKTHCQCILDTAINANFEEVSVQRV